MISIIDEPLYLVDFGLTEIYQYVGKLTVATSESFNVVNEQAKGHQMFKEKFVADIRFERTNEGLNIQSKVKAEMRKSVTYKNEIRLSPQNEVLSCSCACPAGSIPASCKHVFASLHALMDYSQKELYLSSTERLQAWHRPKPTKVPATSFHAVFGKSTPQIPKDKLNYAALFSGNNNVPLLTVHTNSQEILHKFTLPLPACVISQQPTCIIDETSIDQRQFLLKHLKFDITDLWELERKTFEQSSCQTWKNERRLRLTASNFYDIYKCNNEKSLVEKLMSVKDLSMIPAVKYGIENEPYVRNLIQKLFSKHIVRQVGLVSNPYMPHLAASPDGLLFNSEDVMILEIKCIVNKDSKDLEELAENPNFCLEKVGDDWELKQTHKFYYQVQGQLALSNLQKCLFVLFYKQPNFIKTCTISFNKNFWNVAYMKLNQFYLKHYLPVLMLKDSAE